MNIDIILFLIWVIKASNVVCCSGGYTGFLKKIAIFIMSDLA